MLPVAGAFRDVAVVGEQVRVRERSARSDLRRVVGHEVSARMTPTSTRVVDAVGRAPEFGERERKYRAWTPAVALAGTVTSA